ncbi:hypothetical protein Ancab_026095 [Ancistrocladus abbreviatus]
MKRYSKNCMSRMEAHVNFTKQASLAFDAEVAKICGRTVLDMGSGVVAVYQIKQPWRWSSDNDSHFQSSPPFSPSFSWNVNLKDESRPRKQEGETRENARIRCRLRGMMNLQVIKWPFLGLQATMRRIMFLRPQKNETSHVPQLQWGFVCLVRPNFEMVR